MSLKKSFQLWRQDDNGNRFLVGIFSERKIAEGRLDELTRAPHKQTYWIIEYHCGKGQGR